MKQIINLNFKNIDKIFPKNIIKKMRQEDLRIFYIDKKEFMQPNEEKQFVKKMIGIRAESYPSGNEFLVERKAGKLKFINFDED